MTITFKEVGQGDSIILEWEDGAKNKIAIIDCNLKEDGTNPVLIHLTSSKVDFIEFILITHPHYDHFSGANEVLNYCEKNRIKIGFVLHTSFTKKEHLTASVIGNIAKNELEKLLMNILRLSRLSVISEIGYVTNIAREFDLETHWKLKFLAPTASEIDKFDQSAYRNLNAVHPTIEFADANLLSTLIKIYNGSSYIILTSDLVKNVFRKLQRKGLQEFKTNLLFGQLSHHGAEANYYDTFWRQLKYNHGTPIIISVGKNSYNHPSAAAIANLRRNNYDVYCTNALHTSTKTTSVDYLDIISTASATTTTMSSKDWSYNCATNTLS